MNRRSFLAALAAPLIARPTLDEIERLTWRRKFFPGWSPRGRTLLDPDMISLEILFALRANFKFARLVNSEYELMFHRDAFALVYPRIGETLNIRKPRRFSSAAD